MIVVVVLSALFALSLGSEDFLMKEMTASLKCKRDYQIDGDMFMDIMKNGKVPEDDKAKCMVHCSLKGVGYFHDGQFDPKVFAIGNEARYKHDKSVLEAAKNVYMNCIEKDNQNEPNECERSAKFMTCLITGNKEANIPIAKVSL